VIPVFSFCASFQFVAADEVAVCVLRPDLWYGNVNPHETILTENRRYKHLISLMDRNRDELSETLTEKQLETLEKYDETDEQNALACRSRGILLRLPARRPVDGRDRRAAHKRKYITHSGGITPAAETFM